MIHLRLHFDQKGERGQTTLENLESKTRIECHGVEIGKPDWGKSSHSLALSLHNFAGTQMCYIAANVCWKPLEFQLPRSLAAKMEGGFAFWTLEPPNFR